jgi:hypothetical protein
MSSIRLLQDLSTRISNGSTVGAPQYKGYLKGQLNALGLVLNMIVRWNTIYMDAILTQLRNEGASSTMKTWRVYPPSATITSTRWGDTCLRCPKRSHR